MIKPDVSPAFVIQTKPYEGAPRCLVTESPQINRHRNAELIYVSLYYFLFLI